MVIKKRRNIRKLFTWLILALAVIAIFILARRFSKNQDSKLCNDIVVEIKQINGIEYIEETEVKKFIIDHNLAIVGAALNEIDLDSIERSMTKYPFVRQAEVYTDLDSRIHVEIEQMIPILRVHPNGKAAYYLSKEGKTTPLSKKYTAHVIVATGEIPETMNKKLYTLMAYVNESKLWNAQIEQIFVSRDQEITLIPKLGKFTIILGDVDQLESKFSKLERFFKEGLNKTGWDKYKSIDLKYNKLIICK
jgi:cell division protein FtsQ